MAAWFEQIERTGLRHGSSLDLDFHTVPADSAEEPLEKHYISSRGWRQKGILVFLARDAEQRVLCYGNAGIPKAEQADEILRFVEFWKRQRGRAPAGLVFDPQLATYANLSRLDQQGIRFITPRRWQQIARNPSRLNPLPSRPIVSSLQYRGNRG